LCEQKWIAPRRGARENIARDLTMPPPVDRELRIIGNGRGNAGLAPLLGAWRMGAGTGGFALLRAAQPPAIICEPSGFNRALKSKGCAYEST